MSDVELVPIWTGSHGWLDRNYGKGALLPPYAGSTTLTEPTREPPHPSVPDTPGLPVKRCKGCFLRRSIDQFYANRVGLMARCKPCYGAQVRARRARTS